ncbi:hypothetical protein EV360DRAFT_72723 [Lentinula raphanica]|nr:hypothetical protein EV360DRAFT_72723 [Lentinula raphanica]
MDGLSASTVPPDILSLIFEQTVFSTWHNDKCGAVIVLASVCHSWRATCIDASNLWSLITHDYRSYDIICLFLQRSRNHPLRIEYYEDGGDERILPRLVQESERWLEVCLVIQPPFYPLLSSIRGRLPLLRLLNWGHGSRFWWQAGMQQDDIHTSINNFVGFEIAPALSRFSFESPYLRESFPLPWTQLTYLSCAKIHSSNLYSVLLSMPHLSELSLSQVYNDSIDETVIPDGHIFKLASLQVADCDFQILHSILRRIPNVEELTIVIWTRVKMCDFHTPIMLPMLNSLHIRTDRYLPNIAQSFKIHAPMLHKLELACHDAIYNDNDVDSEDEDGDGDEEMPPVWFLGGCGSVMLRFLTELIKDAKCSLTSFKIEMEVNFDPNAMELLLRILPYLEHLDIGLLEERGYRRLPLQAITPACSTLPKLKTLYFRIPNTDFTVDEVNQLLAFVSGSTGLDVKFYRY